MGDYKGWGESGHNPPLYFRYLIEYLSIQH